MCSDALNAEPENLPLLMMRARARIALRRDRDARTDLRNAVRIDPRNSLAYRLLGELAARRSENAPAAMYFREALRLDPGDREAHDWLMIVDALLPLPAPTPPRVPVGRSAPGRHAATESRFARGTQPPAAPRREALDPGSEPPTRRFVRAALGTPFVADDADDKRTTVRPVRPAPVVAMPRSSQVTSAPAREAPRFPPRTRGTTPDLPGFDEYLVTNGILSRERLRAAQAYQRSMKVQLSTAIVTLGLATPQRIEWAAVAHRAQLAERTGSE